MGGPGSNTFFIATENTVSIGTVNDGDRKQSSVNLGKDAWSVLQNAVTECNVMQWNSTDVDAKSADGLRLEVVIVGTDFVKRVLWHNGLNKQALQLDAVLCELLDKK